MNENKVKTNPLDRLTYFHKDSITEDDDAIIGSVVSWRRNGTHHYSLTRQAYNRFQDRIVKLIRIHKVELYPREFGFAVYPVVDYSTL